MHTHTHFNPNGTSSLIDLVLLSVPSQLVNCNVIPPLGNSDHSGISVTLKWSRNPCRVKASKRTIWRYAHADFDKANRLIEATDWSFLKDVSCIDAVWDSWEQKFMSIMEECIPKATITQRRNLPWMNSHIRAKIRKRNNTYRKARTTGRPSLWSKYRSLRNEVVQLLRQSKKHHLQRVSTLGSKQFWKTIKYLRKSSSQVPTLKRGSTEVTSNAEKASLLNDVFSSNFNDTIPL